METLRKHYRVGEYWTNTTTLPLLHFAPASGDFYMKPVQASTEVSIGYSTQVTSPFVRLPVTPMTSEESFRKQKVMYNVFLRKNQFQFLGDMYTCRRELL